MSTEIPPAEPVVVEQSTLEHPSGERVAYAHRPIAELLLWLTRMNRAYLEQDAESTLERLFRFRRALVETRRQLGPAPRLPLPAVPVNRVAALVADPSRLTDDELETLLGTAGKAARAEVRRRLAAAAGVPASVG